MSRRAASGSQTARPSLPGVGRRLGSARPSDQGEAPVTSTPTRALFLKETAHTLQKFAKMVSAHGDTGAWRACRRCASRSCAERRPCTEAKAQLQRMTDVVFELRKEYDAMRARAMELERVVQGQRASALDAPPPSAPLLTVGARRADFEREQGALKASRSVLDESREDSAKVRPRYASND
jgi:hypothetical protein